MIGGRGKGEKTGLRLKWWDLEMRGCHGNDWYADRREGREQTSYGGVAGEETCSRNEYEERKKSEGRKGVLLSQSNENNKKHYRKMRI